MELLDIDRQPSGCDAVRLAGPGAAATASGAVAPLGVSDVLPERISAAAAAVRSRSQIDRSRLHSAEYVGKQTHV